MQTSLKYSKNIHFQAVYYYCAGNSEFGIVSGTGKSNKEFLPVVL